MTNTPTIFVTQEHLDEGKRITDENAGRSIAHVLGSLDSALRADQDRFERDLLRMPDDFTPLREIFKDKTFGLEWDMTGVMSDAERQAVADAEDFEQAIADAQDEPRHYVTRNAKMHPNGLQTACGAVRDWFDVSTDRRVVTCRHCYRVLDDAYQQAVADAEDFDMADDHGDIE